MPQAVQRSDYSDAGLAHLTPAQRQHVQASHSYRTDPNYVIPEGQRFDPRTNSIQRTPSWLEKHAEQLILGTALGVGTMGFAPGGAFAGMGGAGAAGGAAGAGAAAGGSGAIAPTILGGAGAAGAGAGAAGGGGALAGLLGGGAAGGGGMWGTILKAALPLVLGQVAGHQQKNAANQASGGARLQDLMPLLMPLIQQSQQHNTQNYDQQQAQYGQIQPLQAAIARMAAGLMPGGR